MDANPGTWNGRKQLTSASSLLTACLLSNRESFQVALVSNVSYLLSDYWQWRSRTFNSVAIWTEFRFPWLQTPGGSERWHQEEASRVLRWIQIWTWWMLGMLLAWGCPVCRKPRLDTPGPWTPHPIILRLVLCFICLIIRPLVERKLTLGVSDWKYESLNWFLAKVCSPNSVFTLKYVTYNLT